MIDDGRADRLLHALADTTRRDILRRSMDGELSVSALARHYPMSLAAVQKHVTVLQRAGLVTKQPHGREQRLRTDIHAVREATRVLDHLEALWRARIAAVDEILAGGGPDNTPTTPSPPDPTP